MVFVLYFNVWRQFEYWKINSAVRIGPGPSLQYRSVHNPDRASSCPNCGHFPCRYFVDHQCCVTIVPPTSQPPRAAHATTALCALSSRYRSEGEARSLLSPQLPLSSRPLHSASHLPSLLQALSAGHRALPSCARIAASRCLSPRPDAGRREKLLRLSRPSPSSTAERRRVDQPLRSLLRATFAATTSSRAHRHSTTYEPVPSTSSPANRHRFPISRKRHRGQPQ
jgi:hypothetical protein